jgi:hypothetical protein
MIATDGKAISLAKKTISIRKILEDLKPHGF